METPNMITEADLKAWCQTIAHELGYGFPEHIYQKALEMELQENGVLYAVQPAWPICYKGRPIGYHRPDLVIYEADYQQPRWILELKTSPQVSSRDVIQLERYVRVWCAARYDTVQPPVNGLLIHWGPTEVSFVASYPPHVHPTQAQVTEETLLKAPLMIHLEDM